MKYLCFDIESCDGGKNGSLCSFGYCIADENFNIIEQDDIIVNPKKPFNRRLFGSVIKLAYTEEVFRSAPSFPGVYDRIRALFDGDPTVIGFSVINDVNYLADAIRTYRLKPIAYKFFDVQLMYGIFKRQNRNYSLAAAAAEFGIDFLEHRSVDDAVASLKVLKGILDAKGQSFEEFIGKYCIQAGVKSNTGIKNCFTDLFYSEIDYSNEKMRKKLLSEYVSCMPKNKVAGKPFSHKVVCFDENLELGDIDRSRRLISKLYALGGRYSSGIESSNVLVYSDEQSARFKYARTSQENGHRIRFCPLDAFLSKLGDVPDIPFDDVALLSAGNKRRRLAHERAARQKKEHYKRQP